jgi:hypothetical protein
LVGVNQGTIQNSYSTGAVSVGADGQAGGLVGRNPNPHVNKPTVYTSYSTGAVSGVSPSEVGGFAGANGVAQSDTYWDTTTSGTTQGVGKGNKTGITGLTTQQLQSGLPRGFDPSVWGEKPNINNGLPYLLANPPPK